MRLHFIRHGKTEASEKHLYCGSTDVPLSEEGRRDAMNKREIIKEKIKRYPKPDFHITSGKRRTMETQKILFGDVESKSMAEFSEMNFGLFEMKSYQELKHQMDYQKWISDIEKNTCPLGESQAAFINRINDGLVRLERQLKAGDKSAVIVTHGGVIAQVMMHYFPEQRNFYEWQPDFLHGYTIEIKNDTNKYDLI